MKDPADDNLSEQRLRDFAEAASDWFWETDAAGRYVWFSDNVERATGIPAAWHYGKTREEIGVQVANPEVWEQLRTLIAQRKPFRNLEFLRQGPKQLHWIRSSGMPIFDAEGNFKGYRGTGTDITQFKQAQQQLVAAIEAMPDVFAHYDSSERLVLCNRRYREFHQDIEVRVGMRFNELLRALLKHSSLYEASGREKSWYRQRMRRFRRAESLFEAQYGEQLWLEIRQQRMPDGGMVIIGTDISARKQAELAQQRKQAELSAQSELLRTILESIEQGVVVYDRDSHLVTWNKRFRELLKLPDDRFASGTPVRELIDYVAQQGLLGPGSAEEHQALWSQRVKDAEPYNVHVQPNGRVLEIHRALLPDGGVVATYADVTRFKEAERRIQESEQSFRALLENSKHGCFIQQKWRLVYVNDAFVEMLKYQSREELLNLPSLDNIIAPADIKRLRYYAEQRKYGLEVPVEYEFQAVCKDGSTVPLQQAVSLIKWDGKQAYFCSVVDMSSHKQTEQELIAAREASEQMAHIKSEFLANMSHEIRTPLHGILGTAELLLKSPLQPEQHHFADVIHRSGNALLRLIDDILDFSKIEAGKLSIVEGPFGLRDVINDSMELMAEQAHRKNLEWRLELPDNLPGQVNGDALRLRQVLLNLLSNAIKFTEQGKILCTVEIIKRETYQIWLRFCVSDTGIGINPKQLPRLFDYFSQLDSSPSRRYGGAGLGLAISKKIVELMGGHISAQSELNKGSTFCLELPLGLPTGQHLPYSTNLPSSTPAASAGSEPVLAALNILVVEDNPVNQELAKAMLENLGCQVCITENGAEALATLEQTHFDAVLMDCQMPVMDGFTATKAIRRREREQQATVAIPIIALTASAFKNDKARCLAAGMNDFLAKPFTQSSLADMIQRWVEPGLLTSVEEPDDHLPKASDTFSAPGNWVLENQTQEFVEHIIGLYKQQAQTQLQQLEQALTQQDFRRLDRIAHTLKSASSQLGLRKMAELCENIEIDAQQQQINHAAIEALPKTYQEACQFLQEHLDRQDQKHHESPSQ